MSDPIQPNAEPAPTPLPTEDAACVVPAEAPGAEPTSRWKQVGSRALFWAPVFVPMVLFAQVSFLGLRPALCEKSRLADAEVVLRERHQRDVGLAREIQAHVRARQDPVFLERQRRLREAPRATVVASADSNP
ncbi:MAG: hypothetical protein U1F29_04140 [Planctomycetota bacterium]